MHQTRPVNGTDWAAPARFRKAWFAARRRLADWLRTMASRVDRRWTFVIAVPESARLPPRVIEDAMVQGMRVIKRSLDDEVLAAHMEHELQRLHPDLWP